MQGDQEVIEKLQGYFKNLRAIPLSSLVYFDNG